MPTRQRRDRTTSCDSPCGPGTEPIGFSQSDEFELDQPIYQKSLLQFDRGVLRGSDFVMMSEFLRDCNSAFFFYEELFLARRSFKVALWAERQRYNVVIFRVLF